MRLRSRCWRRFASEKEGLFVLACCKPDLTCQRQTAARPTAQILPRAQQLVPILAQETRGRRAEQLLPTLPSPEMLSMRSGSRSSNKPSENVRGHRQSATEPDMSPEPACQ